MAEASIASEEKLDPAPPPSEAEGEDESLDTGAASPPESADGDDGGAGEGIATTLTGDGTPAKEAAVPADWPADWKAKAAGEDKDLAKWLARYGSVGNALKAGHNAVQRIRSGDVPTPFPDQGTDEEKAAWREKTGLPKEASGYLENLPEGLVIGEDDKEMMTGFAERMHDLNAPSSVVQQAIGFYYEMEQEQVAARQQEDLQQKQETEDALHAEWGADYRANWQRVHSLLDGMGEEVKDAFLNARDVRTGRPLASTPAVLRGLLQNAVTINPAGTIVAAGTEDVGKAVADEIAEIEAMMGDPSSAYYTGPKEANGNTKVYNRLRELYEFDEAQKQRARTRAA